MPFACSPKHPSLSKPPPTHPILTIPPPSPPPPFRVSSFEGAPFCKTNFRRRQVGGQAVALLYRTRSTMLDRAVVAAIRSSSHSPVLLHNSTTLGCPSPRPISAWAGRR